MTTGRETFCAGWRLRLTRPTCGWDCWPGNLVGPRKRQRRRAMATRAVLCRVAAAPDPAYMRDGTAGPGKRSATGEGGFNGGSFLGQIEGES